MTTTALVGPLPTVSFHGGPTRLRHSTAPYDPPKVVYDVPHDTCDPRYVACTDHHVACDCREAEWAEFSSEYRYERRELRTAVDEVLFGHPTWQWDGDTFTGCMCTGCQIARSIGIYPRKATT